MQITSVPRDQLSQQHLAYGEPPRVSGGPSVVVTSVAHRTVYENDTATVGRSHVRAKCASSDGPHAHGPRPAGRADGVPGPTGAHAASGPLRGAGE